MGLEQADTIDLMMRPLPGDGCSIVLYIIDSGDITDELRRYQLLIAKLTTYVGYVLGEQFQANYPGLGPADVLIRVLCVRPPNEAMVAIQRVGPKGEEGNRIRVVFADYEEFMAREETCNHG